MPRRWGLAWLPALAAAAVCIAAPAPEGAPAPTASARGAVLAQCVAEAGADVRGLHDLSDACPGVEAAVHALALDGELPADWQQNVSTRALGDWSALSARYAHPAGSLRLPEPGRLQAIARGLPPEAVRPPPRPSIWVLALRWLRDFLRRHREWFGGLPAVSPQSLAVLLFGLLGLVLAGAAVILYIELRAAGLLGAARGRSLVLRRPLPAAAPVDSEPESTDLAAAPPHLRPVLLLRALVAALARSRRLQHERILTCRELVTAARFDSDTQRERFAALAVLAERGLYGGPGGEPPDEAVLAAAQSLAGPLAAPAPPAGTL